MPRRRSDVPRDERSVLRALTLNVWGMRQDWGRRAVLRREVDRSPTSSTMRSKRERQAVVTAAAIEVLLAERPGHVIVAGDLDADPESASVRWGTGRHGPGGGRGRPVAPAEGRAGPPVRFPVGGGR